MSDEGKKEYSGHVAPNVEAKIVSSDGIGKSGHAAPSGVGPVTGSGHTAPVRLDPTNLAPPPKRDDSGSSAKPPK